MSNIIKGSGIIYTTGQPNTIPSVGTDAEFAIDVNGVQYAWNRDSGVWDNIGQGIEISNSNAVPSNTPTKFKPRFVVTPDRTLYFYSGSWGKVNPLPSGLFSSSAQIGNTGIYSGSGWLNGTTIVDNLGAFPFRVENVENPEDFKFILNPSNEIFIGLVNGSSIYITSDPHMIIGSSNNFMLFDPIGSYSGGPGIKVQDWNPEPKGIEYIGDYNTHIKTNDRSIPDVGTIRNHLTSSYANNGVKYKTLAFTLTQTGTNAPEIQNILQDDYNGTVEITLSRAGVGHYRLTTTENIFHLTKTIVLTNNNFSINDNTIIRYYVDDINTFPFFAYFETTLVDLETDNPLFMEIRTYG